MKEFIKSHWGSLPHSFNHLLYIDYLTPIGLVEVVTYEVTPRTLRHIISMPVERLVDVCCYLLDKRQVIYNRSIIENLVIRHKLKAVSKLTVQRIRQLNNSLVRYYLKDLDREHLYKVDLFSDNDGFLITHIIENVRNLEKECADDCEITITDKVITDYLKTRIKL